MPWRGTDGEEARDRRSAADIGTRKWPPTQRRTHVGLAYGRAAGHTIRELAKSGSLSSVEANLSREFAATEVTDNTLSSRPCRAFRSAVSDARQRFSTGSPQLILLGLLST
jgi:hypothetical protein